MRQTPSRNKSIPAIKYQYTPSIRLNYAFNRGKHMKTTEQLTKERDELRKKWLLASRTDQKIIEHRGKLLTWAIEAREKAKPAEKEAVVALAQGLGL